MIIRTLKVKERDKEIKIFVPYFLFLNVKFNGTVRPFEYQEILAPRIKGMPTSTHHTSTHKEAQNRLTIPGHPYIILLSKSLVLSFQLYMVFNFLSTTFTFLRATIELLFIKSSYAHRTSILKESRFHIPISSR